MGQDSCLIGGDCMGYGSDVRGETCTQDTPVPNGQGVGCCTLPGCDLSLRWSTQHAVVYLCRLVAHACSHHLSPSKGLHKLWQDIATSEIL